MHGSAPMGVSTLINVLFHKNMDNIYEYLYCLLFKGLKYKKNSFNSVILLVKGGERGLIGTL